MTKEQGKLHPLLLKLGLVKGTPGDKYSPSARDLLNYLLLNQGLTEQVLQTAYDCLHQQTKDRASAAETAAMATQEDMKNLASTTAPKYRTRHIALQFYYDGADYSGLAENVGTENDKSVERAVFTALHKTNFIESRETCGYSRCGRTDRGVSSAGQVVAMHLKSNVARNASWDEAGDQLVQDEDLPKNSVDTIRVWVPPKKGDGPRVEKEVAEYPYEKVLNNVLPSTIRILGCCPVSDGFSARFSATTRTYRYFFVRRPNMNLDKMTEALNLLVGKHDFRNFCKMDVEKVYNFERLIHSAELMEHADGNICHFQILGQAFLWHQIRCIVSVLFMVGRGLEEPSVVTELLDVEKYPGKPSYNLAPERPLVLHHCAYKDLGFGHLTQNLWQTNCELERQWEELVLSAARVRNCIQSLEQLPLLRHDVVQFGRAKVQERFKKKQKHTPTSETMENHLADLEDGLTKSTDDGDAPQLVSWASVLAWLETKQFTPSPEDLRVTAHIPLLQRHKGTTYEEKIEALSQSKRRRERYVENVVKKRKTKEEDAAFYEHMAAQGGSAI